MAFIFVLILISVTYQFSHAAYVDVQDTSECREGGETFPQIVKLDESSIKIEPEKPVLPGCFNMSFTANITSYMDYLAADIELRLVDWNSQPLPCQEENKNCGSKGSCNVCNFCKSLEHLGFFSTNDETQIKYRALGRDNDCVISPGQYTSKTEICTPSKEVINNYLPIDVLKQYFANAKFGIYTRMYLIRKRYRNLNPWLSEKVARQVMKSAWLRNRDEWIAGCYQFAANIEFDGF